MKTIINLTQHTFTTEQSSGFNKYIDTDVNTKETLTFTSLPSKEEISNRASILATKAKAQGATHAMIGGAPYLMSPLEYLLKTLGIQPLYAYSERVSEEVTQPDGSVVKTNVFKHKGFVEA